MFFVLRFFSYYNWLLLSLKDFCITKGGEIIRWGKEKNLKTLSIWVTSLGYSLRNSAVHQNFISVPDKFLLYSLTIIKLQINSLKKKNLTISVRKVISRSKDERWEKWRSFSKSVTKCILEKEMKHHIIIRTCFKT